MKLIHTTRTVLALLLAMSISTVSAADTTPTCVDVSELYSEISAESEVWQRARLDSLSEPTSACEELQLGLLLSHTKVSFQNDAKALDALSHALLLLPDDAVDKPVLSMMIEHIEERQTLRNMLGKSQRQLRYRQQQINTLRDQINQLKNLDAQFEEKSREAIATDTAVTPEASAIEQVPASENPGKPAVPQENQGE